MPQTEQHFTVPTALTSPRTKLVYLYLVSAGETTVTELNEALDVSRLTLLPILRSLDAQGFVRRTEGGYAPE
jgi:DNA-binding MarR family transcriptional regulator